MFLLYARGDDVDYIQWILDGRVDKFYNSRPWRNLRLKALERDHQRMSDMQEESKCEQDCLC